VAAVVLERFGLAGMVLFKFGLILLVICICESVGRRRPGTGRRLALWSIGLTCVPVMWALVLLCVHG
jgi:hypothetical protein